MKTIRVELTTIAPMLGTCSGNPKLHEDYIASKAPSAKETEEEMAALSTEEAVEKTMTVFPRDNKGNPIIWNYQIKGFLKAASRAMKKVPGSETSKCKAHIKELDTLIFIFPDANDRTNRQIPIIFDGEMTDLQRPLRAQTMQGERVALAHSEAIPAGAKMTFDILLMIDSDEKMIRELLDYGQYNGLLQWRNAGYGSFTWREIG